VLSLFAQLGEQRTVRVELLEAQELASEAVGVDLLSYNAFNSDAISLAAGHGGGCAQLDVTSHHFARSALAVCAQRRSGSSGLLCQRRGGPGHLLAVHLGLVGCHRHGQREEVVDIALSQTG
jgi:hypothetical protein